MTEGDDTWRTRDMKRSGEGRGGREGVRTGSGKKKSQAKCEVAKKQLNKKKGGGRAGAKTGEAGKRMRCCGTDAR